MGNQKFKLTNIISNTWFYKLKRINISSKINTKPDIIQQAPPSSPPIIEPPPRPEPHFSSRKSYHISRELTLDLPNELPRKSKSSRKSSRSSSISTSTCSCQSSSTFHSYHSKETKTDVVAIKTPPNNNNAGFLVEDALLKTNYKQSILNCALPDNKKNNNNYQVEHVENLKIQLPPIQTKKPKKPKNIEKQNKMSILSPGGVRLKTNTPKIIGRKQGQNSHKNRKNPNSKTRKSISGSFAVVKSSIDPQQDFKESMVEMIQQNNLTAVKDLEDLLACYLSLNSDEYHHLIIKVFKQIWIDFRHPK